jgi:Flp pilus assembly pilin Flp
VEPEMSGTRSRARRFLVGEDGGTAVEDAMMLAPIVMA